MDHDTIRGLIPAYALGATDREEGLAVEAHLPSCPECRALLVEHRSLADDLLFAMPPLAAPAGMAERMQRQLAAAQAQAAPPSRWTRLRSGWALPALAGLVALLVITNLYWWSRASGLERRASMLDSSLAGLGSAPYASLRADPSGGNAQGVLYRSGDGQVALVCVYNMPALPAGKTYQLWLVKDGARESGGVFQVTQDGFGLLTVRPQGPLDAYDALGITVEPEGGSPAPTTPRVIGTTL